MQKIIMLLFALLITTVVNAQSVYIATSSGAVAYHKSKDCGYLRNAKEVKPVSKSGAEGMGRHACTACYGGRTSAATKTSPKVSRPSATKKITSSGSPSIEKKDAAPRKTGKNVVAEKEIKVKADAKEKAGAARKTSVRKSAEAKEQAGKAGKTVTRKASDAKEKAAPKTRKTATKKASTAGKTVKEAA